MLLANLSVPAELASAVVSQLGCNPLTLRLAARVLAEGGKEQLSGIRSRNFGLLAVGEEVVRGQLYRRILDHIHEPDVRVLAHPGMVLRRLTPVLIRSVLVPALELAPVSADQAQALEEKLAGEHTLVKRDGAGALLYRAELRRPMLKALAADKPTQVDRLHRAAAAYYSGFRDDTSGAEEIYHCLMLPDPDFLYLETRWSSAVAPSLLESFEELPEANRAWLASMTGQRLTAKEQSFAGDAETVNIVGREALQYFRRGDYRQAEIILGRQNAAPESPLLALRARALIELGQRDRASALLQQAISAFPPFGDRDQLAELLWLACQTDDEADALSWLEPLLYVTADLPSPLPRIQALTEIVRLAGPDTRDDFVAQLASALRIVELHDVDRERAMMRLALVRLGPRFPDIWGRLVPYLIGDLIYELSVRDPKELDSLRSRIVEALDEAAPGSRLAPLQESVRGNELTPALLRNIGSLVASILATAGAGTTVEGAPADGPPADGNDTLLAVRAAYALFCAEETSLAASTLAGIARARFYDDGSSSFAIA